jgi:hypothetical protein
MRFIDWKKQNVVVLIHFIENKEVNVKMHTGGALLTSNEIHNCSFSIPA